MWPQDGGHLIRTAMRLSLPECTQGQSFATGVSHYSYIRNSLKEISYSVISLHISSVSHTLHSPAFLAHTVRGSGGWEQGYEGISLNKIAVESFIHCKYQPQLNLSVQMHLEIIKHGKTEYHMFFYSIFYDRIIGGGWLRSLVYSIEQALS